MNEKQLTIREARTLLACKYPTGSVNINVSSWVHPYGDRSVSTTEFGGCIFQGSVMVKHIGGLPSLDSLLAALGASPESDAGADVVVEGEVAK